MNKAIKKSIHNSKEKVTSEILPIFTFQAALWAVVTPEGKESLFNS